MYFFPGLNIFILYTGTDKKNEKKKTSTSKALRYLNKQHFCVDLVLLGVVVVDKLGDIGVTYVMLNYFVRSSFKSGPLLMFYVFFMSIHSVSISLFESFKLIIKSSKSLYFYV